MSDSLVRVSRRVEWGARWPGAKAAQVPRGHASVVSRHPSSVREAAYPAGGIIRPGLGRPYRSLARYLALGRNLRPIWAAFPNNPTSPTTPRGLAGSGHNGAVTLSGPPFHGTCARSVAKGGFCELQFERRPLDSHLGLFRLSSPVTRGILGLGPRLEPAAGGLGGGATTFVVPKCPWGKVFFSQPRPGARATNLLPRTTRPFPPAVGAAGHGGWGGLRRAWRPGRCTLDLVASGATCVQRLRWFAGFCNSHQVSHFARSSSITRAKISVARVVLGYRVEVGPPRASSLNSTDRARVVVRVLASRTVAGAGAETRRRPVANAWARGFDGRLRTRPSARRPSGHRVQLR
ncbi:hypothetical protein H6P81_015970 [Aristolochia fimbriata]|uniref:Uncharacterized protein n=1 Tax=Aristolochia fimbriata TaxID=158543 RepID=A0AAV7E708_ARIFI|nr:hypothetical protein H6P81_015970 [Aristolochia fimbriata]